MRLRSVEIGDGYMTVKIKPYTPSTSIYFFLMVGKKFTISLTA